MTVKSIALLLVWVALFFWPASVESQDKRTVTLGGVTLNYHFMDDASARKEAEISRLVAQAYAAYEALFAGRPRDLSGNDYADIAIHVRKGRHLGGEADPKLIMLTWNDDQLFGFANWQTLLLHELFHLWSAESFRYKDGREHWFNEGFTEYYALKTAVQLGLISSEDMLVKAAFPIGYYSSSKGLGKISMRDAGKTNKTKFENYFLVYHGGWVTAMLLDHDIRKRTDNEKSLDDLMRWMYSNYHRHEALYSLNDIIKGLKIITKHDYSDFFNRYVDGKEKIPVSDYFPLSDAVWAAEMKSHYSLQYHTLYQALGVNLRK